MVNYAQRKCEIGSWNLVGRGSLRRGGEGCAVLWLTVNYSSNVEHTAYRDFQVINWLVVDTIVIKNPHYSKNFVLSNKTEVGILSLTS